MLLNINMEPAEISVKIKSTFLFKMRKLCALQWWLNPMPSSYFQETTFSHGCYRSFQSSTGPRWNITGRWQPQPPFPSVSGIMPLHIITISMVFVPSDNIITPLPLPPWKWALESREQKSSTLLSWKNWNWLFQNTSFNLVGDDFSFHGNRNKNKHDNFCIFSANASAIKYRNAFHSRVSTKPAHIPVLQMRWAVPMGP